MCPSLTLQQIYKLSEHHHDDWITAVGDNQGTKTIVLLETLKRAVDSSGGVSTTAPASPMRSADGPQTPGGGPPGYPSPASVSSRHSGFEDEDNLLLDSHVGVQTAHDLPCHYCVWHCLEYDSCSPWLCHMICEGKCSDQTVFEVWHPHRIPQAHPMLTLVAVLPSADLSLHTQVMCFCRLLSCYPASC